MASTIKLFTSFWIVYIGEVCKTKLSATATVTTVIAMATLGSPTQIAQGGQGKKGQA
jgi:hypothetical protein